jgi:hypothetical protein
MWCRKGRARLIRSIPILFTQTRSPLCSNTAPVGGSVGREKKRLGRRARAGMQPARHGRPTVCIPPLFRSAASEPPPGASRSGPIESALEAPRSSAVRSRSLPAGWVEVEVEAARGAQGVSARAASGPRQALFSLSRACPFCVSLWKWGQIFIEETADGLERIDVKRSSWMHFQGLDI